MNPLSDKTIFAPLTETAEAERLQALHQYAILDTPNEPEFDDLLALASFICGAPISFISFIAQDRQWFKARIGLAVADCPRAISFCEYALLSDNVFEIPDTHEDIRFFHNPLVTGDPNIRFYAGMPLVNEQGYKVGTMCVLDTEPRSLTEAQKMALATLSAQVVAQLELRLVKQQLEHEKRQSRQANAKLHELQYTVVHHIQEPMHHIQQIAGALSDSISQNDYSHLLEKAAQLVQQANRLQTTLTSLLP